MREVNVCVRHSHPLIPLWGSDNPRNRYDIKARLREIEDDILSGALDQPASPPSFYDLWLDRRLLDGQDETWFRKLPLFAATTCCRLLGQALPMENQTEGTPDPGSVHAAGFNVARHGETTIQKALNQIAAAATGHLDEPNKAFGALFPALNRDYAEQDGFGPLRRILRECILDHWPVAPGEVLLGEVVTERRLHSLVTAAKEIGVGADIIEKFLIEAGAFYGQGFRPRSRRVFAANAHAELLAEIPTLVSSPSMRKAMGATKSELAALKEEGLLIPRTRASKVKNPWRISDGAALVGELLTSAVPVALGDKYWETLLLACRRSEISLSTLVGAIREGRLSVGQRVSVPGFHGIVVNMKEVDSLVTTLRATERLVEAELPGVAGAAAFGRSVGLRDHGDFLALIEAGQTPALHCTNPRTGRLQYRLSAEHIASFHRRFVTLTTLSEETGLHRNTLKRLLANSRVTRFTADGRDFGPVYLRSEAVRAVK